MSGGRSIYRINGRSGIIALPFMNTNNTQFNLRPI